MDITRICNKCKNTKILECFDNQKNGKFGKASICKECRREEKKTYRNSNKEKIKKSNKKYAASTAERRKIYQKELYEKNKEILKIKREALKQQKKEYAREYRKINKEKKRRSALKYYQKNKQKILKKGNERTRQREKKDLKFKIDRRIGNLIYQDVKRFGLKKNRRSWKDIVGYSVEELVEHLKSKFKEGMTMENYGSYWHIDHIKPRSLFTYTSMEDEQFKECWALSNLQPLEALENIRKGNKYEESTEQSTCAEDDVCTVPVP